MLSPGTRIGPHRVRAWISEGACGQSYESESTEGEKKGDLFFLKLLPREISEQKGFEDSFVQECQALEQLEGPGIWPMRKFGVMKWKHWIAYDWMDGKEVPAYDDQAEIESSELEEGTVCVRTLGDDLKSDPLPWTPQMLLDLMICLHQGLNKSHLLGLPHGNLKPTNIIVQRTENRKTAAWITESGLYRLLSFLGDNSQESSSLQVAGMTLEAQSSMRASEDFRPAGQEWGQRAEESWDLFALGSVTQEILKKTGSQSAFKEWREWAEKATSKEPFQNVTHSVSALPGIGDLKDYGFSLKELDNAANDQSDDLRAKREKEWEFKQKSANLRFRRNITGLVGTLFLLGYLMKTVYLFFFPAAWTEYALPGVLDSYQLGAGLWSGQAWGILPNAYDADGEGGQDVVGKWEKSDGLFRLEFRKFKQPEESGEKKKLWQFIGKGATAPDDYHYWSDYLKYDRSEDRLLFIKRVDKFFTYRPGREKGKSTRLYPEDRFKDSKSGVLKAELSFLRVEKSRISWEFFIGVGFLWSSLLYRRNLSRLIKEAAELT